MKKIVALMLGIVLLAQSSLVFSAAKPATLKNNVVFEMPIKQLEGTFYDELTIGKGYSFYRTESTYPGIALIKTTVSFEEATKLVGNEIATIVKVEDQYLELITSDEQKKKEAEGLIISKADSYGSTPIKYEAIPNLKNGKDINLDVFLQKQSHTYEYYQSFKMNGRLLYLGAPLSMVLNTTNVPLVSYADLEAECPKLYQYALTYYNEIGKLIENNGLQIDKQNIYFKQLTNEAVQVIQLNSSEKFTADSNMAYMQQVQTVKSQAETLLAPLKIETTGASSYTTKSKNYQAESYLMLTAGKYLSESVAAVLKFSTTDSENLTAQVERVKSYSISKPTKVAWVEIPQVGPKSSGILNVLKVVYDNQYVDLIDTTAVGTDDHVGPHDMTPFLKKTSSNSERALIKNTDFVYASNRLLYFSDVEKDYQLMKEAVKSVNVYNSLSIIDSELGTYKNGNNYVKLSSKRVNNQGVLMIETNLISGKKITLETSKYNELRMANYRDVLNMVGSYKEGKKTISKKIAIFKTANNLRFVIDGKSYDLSK